MQQAVERDLSYWLTYRKTMTDRFMPPMRTVKDLYYKKPFWYPFRFTLTSQQTLEFRQTARRNFKLVTLAGLAPSVAGFLSAYSVQIYDVGARRGFSRLSVWNQNFAGTGPQRYWIREPYLFRAGTTIMVQVHNLTTAALTSEFVLEGVNTDA